MIWFEICNDPKPEDVYKHYDKDLHEVIAGAADVEYMPTSLNHNAIYYKIYSNFDEIGILTTYRSIGSFFTEVHLTLKKEYRKVGKFLKVVTAMAREFKNNRKVNTLVTYVPSTNTNMIRLYRLSNFKESGKIPKSILYNKIQDDILIYVREVN